MQNGPTKRYTDEPGQARLLFSSRTFLLVAAVLGVWTIYVVLVTRSDGMLVTVPYFGLLWFECRLIRNPLFLGRAFLGVAYISLDRLRFSVVERRDSPEGPSGSRPCFPSICQ